MLPNLVKPKPSFCNTCCLILHNLIIRIEEEVGLDYEDYEAWRKEGEEGEGSDDEDREDESGGEDHGEDHDNEDGERDDEGGEGDNEDGGNGRPLSAGNKFCLEMMRILLDSVVDD
jgi:hypothetical protein